MDNLHRHIPVEALLALRGEVVSPGQLMVPPNPCIQPYAPPTDFLMLLRRECKDEGLTAYMTVDDGVWHLAADGFFNPVEGVDAEWNRPRRAVVPVLTLKKADGTELKYDEIQNLDYQHEAVAYAVGASAQIHGGAKLLQDIAEEQVNFIRKERANGCDEIGEAIKALPYQAVSKLRDDYGDPTRIRAERVADAARKGRIRQQKDEDAEAPAQIMRKAALGLT